MDQHDRCGSGWPQGALMSGGEETAAEDRERLLWPIGRC